MKTPPSRQRGWLRVCTLRGGPRTLPGAPDRPLPRAFLGLGARKGSSTASEQEGEGTTGSADRGRRKLAVPSEAPPPPLHKRLLIQEPLPRVSRRYPGLTLELSSGGTRHTLPPIPRGHPATPTLRRLPKLCPPLPQDDWLLQRTRHFPPKPSPTTQFHQHTHTPTEFPLSVSPCTVCPPEPGPCLLCLPPYPQS